MAIDHEKDPYAAERQAIRDWLIEFRRRRKLSQRQLANRISIGRATVDRWEAGKAWPIPSYRRILGNLGRDVGMGPFPPVPGEEA